MLRPTYCPTSPQTWLRPTWGGTRPFPGGPPRPSPSSPCPPPALEFLGTCWLPGSERSGNRGFWRPGTRQWSEVPALALSGQQLQPEEASTEAEEAHPVTVGPADEIVRPRPQGSSPVYECAAEGAGLGFAVSLLDRDPQEDTPSRHSSSGRRRSWWKWDSGGSRTSSRMSRPEEAMEVTLKTEVETGASGYSVTGGAEQGIFVKQVLKGSAAAKLFSLREGDQLLSTTIFFDDIKYEDALKILQYSEPYKVQFQIKRRLPAGEDQEWASSGAPHDPEDSDTQDKAVADGDTETPSTALEGGGDRESLISKPREGRGRRPKNERVSWPKFQAIKPKHGPGPRRSHSSSEACEQEDGPDASPTNTDTEAQLPAEEQELKAGPDNQPRRRFLNLRFRAGSGKGLVPVGRPGREAPGGLPQAGVLEEAGTRGDAREDARTARREDRVAEAEEGAAAPSEQQRTEPSLPSEDSLGAGGRVAPRGPRKTKEGKVQEETVAQGKPGPGPAPGQDRQAHREGGPGLETGAAADVVSTHSRPPEFQVRIPTLKTPKFGFSKETVLDTEGGMMALQLEQRRGHPGRKDTVGEQADGGADRQGGRSTAQGPPPEKEAGAGDRTQDGEEDSQAGDDDTEGWDRRMKTLRFKMPSFGWPPGREPRAPAVRVVQGREMEKGSPALQMATHTDGSRRPTAEGGDTDVQEPGQTRREEGQSGRKETHTTPGDGKDAKDSKFKMPKFKMPSFGMSAPSTSTEASVDVSLPKARAEVCLPSIHGDVNTSDLPTGLPLADLDIKTAEVVLKLPEGPVPGGELQEAAAGAGHTEHLPKLQMPSIKMPEVDVKGPQVDIKGPKLDVKGAKGEPAIPDVEVAVPSIEVDIQVPDANLLGDLSLGDKEVSTRHSKFKMPKFKMPSFGVSAPSKDLETSVEVPVPKVTVEATRPSLGGETQAPECSVQLPSADVHLPRGELEVVLPGAKVTVSEVKGKAEGARIKGHLPKVQMPSTKMPKVDIRGPSVDVKGPSVDVREVAVPSPDVDIQVPGAKLEGELSLTSKEVAARDSKFKMPKFKMPSFGMSAPSTSTEASMDVSLPKAQANVCLPSIQADVKSSDHPIELPSADLDNKTAKVAPKLPEGPVPGGELQEAAVGAGRTGHLPKLQMPSIKMPKVDLKGPRVDIKGPKLDMKGVKGEAAIPDVEEVVPSMEVDIEVPGAKLEGDLSLGDKEVSARHSKFKMPKFKMPSFGVSAPSKDLETSVDVPVPKVTVEAPRPFLGGEVQAPECSVRLPSADVHLPGGELEVSLPVAEVTVSELKGKAEGARIKAHLPKVPMPEVDVKAPSMDIKGPTMHVKGKNGEVASPDVQVAVPSIKVDIQEPGAKVEGDLSLTSKEVAIRDSKFKMPKFKMPSFGVSAPSKDLETSVEVPVPKVAVEATRPSLEGELQAPECSVQLPSADVHLPGGELEVALPVAEVTVSELKGKVEGARIKAHLPKVPMPSIKMPKVDIKGPSVDVKCPSVDIKGPSVDVREVAVPSPDVDIQVPGAKLEGDLSLTSKEVAVRDSKFKMPKFKMPSFGVSVPSTSTEASVDVSLPKAQAEVCLPSIQADINTSDLPIGLPSADLDVKTAEVVLKLPEGHVPGGELQEVAAGVGRTGHLPKLQMPSIKMPKVDLKGPRVDIKGPKLDVKGAKGEPAIPDVEVAVPSMEVEVQVPGAKLEGDLSLGDKEVSTRDSKFKMPKFKMPSFGMSAANKDLETSVDVPVPKVTVEATRPFLRGELQAPECSIQLPLAGVHLPGRELEVVLPRAEVTVSELKGKVEGAQIKAHLPKVQMPSIKMPKVDVKAPSVDIKDPTMHVKGKKKEVASPDMQVAVPSIKVDIQVPGAKLEDDLSLTSKEVAVRDSKFKMPKFKMPSFGVSAPSKDLETSVDVPVPKVAVEATRPSLEGETQAPECSVQLPSADVHLPGGELEVALPVAEVTVSELKGKVEGARIKGHLPKVQMPSTKMPKVDIRGPSVDVKGPSVDVREVAVPSPDVDIQVPGAKLEGELSLTSKEVAARDSKFKMPKFKMPSFGMSAPSTSTEASMDVSLPKAQANVCLPSIQADVKSSDHPIELPSADLDNKTAKVAPKLPEGPVPGGELQEAAVGAGRTGHLPKLQMPSIKMPKVDLKGPRVDIKGPKLDMKGVKGEAAIPDVEEVVPSMEVDIEVPDANLLGDLSLGDKEVSARHSKFKMPKFKMPSFGVSAPSKDLETSVDVPVPKVTVEATRPSLGGETQAPECSVQLPSADVHLPGGELEVALPVAEVTVSELKGKVEGARIKAHLPKVQMPSTKMPEVDVKAPSVDIKGPSVDLHIMEGEVTVPRSAVPLEVPLASPSVSQGDAPWPSLQGTPVYPAFTSVLLSQVDSGTGPTDSPFPTSCVQVTFPMFRRPRFVFSVPRAGIAEAQPACTERALAPSPPSPVRRPDPSAGEAAVFLLPSAGVSVSTGTEGLSGTVGTSAVASGAAPAADAPCKGKGSSLKTPKLELPSFRSSPKKGAGSREDPVGSLGGVEISLVVDAVPSDVPAGVHAAQMDAPPDVTPEKDAEKGVVLTPGFAGLEPPLPSTGVPRRGAGLLHTDPDSSLSSPPGKTESPATGTSSGKGGGDTSATAVPSDTAGVNPQLPWVHVPRLGLATPTLGPCEGDLPFPKHGLSFGDGGTGHGSGDSSACQPCGEATAPSTEDPLPPSCRMADGEGPAEGSPEWAVLAGSQESWHRMPTLHLPSARHSSEERGGAGGPRGLLCAPAAGSPREGVRRQDTHIPGPEVTVSLQSPEADVGVAAAESTSHADVLRHSLDSRSSKLHLPPARVSASDPSTFEAGVCPGEGPLPLQVPQRRLPESYRLPREAGRAVPPGPAGQDLSRGEKGAGEWSSHPEGPLKLKVSTTDVPSQISVVTTSQLWEDSVLTVRFPRLKVPRLTYPVPGSEADIFIPAVREIQCPDSSLGMALQRESPGVWDASILKAGAGGPRERPVVPGLSSEASPISKVRVHIQGAPAESQGGAMCSRVTAEFAGVADPRAFSTQVVRESEIPASEVQTPAYGFSLLKVKIPEALPRAGARVGTPDSRLRQALQEAPARAAPGADPASGDLQSDTGEPFEMMSSSVTVPGLQTCVVEVCSGHQFADSCSDEEPAEILEFPPEDSQEAAPAEEGRAPGAEPESRKGSGLFRLWLPNIGFSSSVDEKSAESEDTLQRPEAGPPPRPEKTGWFRFPKLGFSSPTKKSAHAEDEARLAEQKLQEEAATFFDAHDSFPLEEDDGRRAEAAGPTPAPARC
ncbi:protein AHNAK2 isoform X5 [Manis pentadactyla]|uniref:protein AHNAK2 isoform X5 n=1 Tax=Manis pentadactyla TaxID=143292 RepID=UPI00255CD048|nr:protein AHNAK2 isoform X5 [Manis pentadactyla]